MYPGEKTGTQEENELWNQIHVTLVRDLETKGILWRYGIKHLKLWTDLILDGKCSGAGEEPTWEEYLEQVIVPPKSRRTCTSASSTSSSSSSNNTSQEEISTKSFIEMMMMQNQQRMDAERMFQQTLLTMMSTNFAPTMQNQVIIVNFIGTNCKNHIPYFSNRGKIIGGRPTLCA